MLLLSKLGSKLDKKITDFSCTSDAMTILVYSIILLVFLTFWALIFGGISLTFSIYLSVISSFLLSFFNRDIAVNHGFYVYFKIFVLLYIFILFLNILGTYGAIIIHQQDEFIDFRCLKMILKYITFAYWPCPLIAFFSLIFGRTFFTKTEKDKCKISIKTHGTRSPKSKRIGKYTRRARRQNKKHKRQ